MFYNDDYECVECGESLVKADDIDGFGNDELELDEEDDQVFYNDDNEPLCRECWEKIIGYD